MTGNLPIPLPRLKVGILSALLYLSPLSFSQLYVVSTDELHIVENTIVVGDIIRVSDSTDSSDTELQVENSPENEGNPVAAISEPPYSEINTEKKEGVVAKERKKDPSPSESETAFLPILPDSHMTAAMKSAMVALPGSNYQNRIGLTASNFSGIPSVYSELQSDSTVVQNKVYYREITIFAIRPPPEDI